MKSLFKTAYRRASAVLAVGLVALSMFSTASFAAGKGDTLETDLLKLIFNATAIANIADNAASAPLSNLYVGLYSADPTDSGDQTSNECGYTDYARVAVARTTGGWTVSGNTVSNVGAITFPAASGSSCTATYFAVGTAASSTGELLYVGALTGSLAISTGITPAFAIGDLTVTED